MVLETKIMFILRIVRNAKVHYLGKKDIESLIVNALWYILFAVCISELNQTSVSLPAE